MAPKKIKILIIEHDLLDSIAIEHVLKIGFINCTTKVIQSEIDFKKALYTFKPDIILSNYTFPSFDGMNIFMLKQKLNPQIPFIFVSKSIDLEDVIHCIKIGVNDLVLKENLSSLIDKVNITIEETKQKLLEQNKKCRIEELCMNEAKFKALFENSVDGILLTVTDGQILAANPAACRIFQRSEQEIIDNGRYGIVDIEDPRLEKMLKERQQKGRVTGELTFIRKDGSKFPGEITSAVYKVDNGEERTSMIIRDITESKEVKEQINSTTYSLQQALNDLTKILDFSLDLICSYDEKGRIVRVNKASECILGYKSEELIGEKYINFIFHDDIEKTMNADNDIRNGKQLTMFENRFIHKSGNVIPLLWSAMWDDEYKISYCVAKDITENKKLEQAFEIERQRFRDLHLQAPSCMGILKGPNHVYELANNLYLQLIGKKDIIGKTVKQVLPELEAQGFFEFLDTVYKTGETFSASEMLVKFDYHGNGKLVDTYLNFIYQAHRNSEGNIDGIFFFANNVTEQVLSRKRIEESVLRYSSLIEQASDAICFVNPEMRIIEVNHYTCEKLGYTREEIFQLSINDIFLEDDFEPDFLKAHSLKRGDTMREERRILTKDGALIEVEMSAKILKDNNILLFIRDISEYKKAQRALMENEKKYRYLFEHNPMPMWVIDLATFKFLDVNKMAVLQYGYSREEFLSMTILDIRPDEDKDLFKKSINSSEINATNFNRGIWNHKKKDGTIILVEIIAHEIMYEGIKARFILSNDITNRRKAELNLERRNKELIKTNSELDRFVYSVSHDLRSPLTSVLGLLSFIEGESEEPDTIKHTKMIRNSINRLDEFIKNILSYSRNNRTGLEIEKIPLQQKILAIVHDFQSLDEATEIHYEIDIREQQPFYTDRLRLKTILENLISNAIKHHKRGVSDRYIKIIGQSDHDKLQLTIADNGIGIAPAYHQKIFEMFFRLSGKTDGSGIGLYIVKDTIEILQGSIEIQSEKGIGTTFVITLKNLKP